MQISWKSDLVLSLLVSSTSLYYAPEAAIPLAVGCVIKATLPRALEKSANLVGYQLSDKQKKVLCASFDPIWPVTSTYFLPKISNDINPLLTPYFDLLGNHCASRVATIISGGIINTVFTMLNDKTVSATSNALATRSDQRQEYTSNRETSGSIIGAALKSSTCYGVNQFSLDSGKFLSGAFCKISMDLFKKDSWQSIDLGIRAITYGAIYTASQSLKSYCSTTLQIGLFATNLCYNATRFFFNAAIEEYIYASPTYRQNVLYERANADNTQKAKVA